MSVVEYLTRKNKMIEELCGVTLVPEGQIVEIEKRPLSMENDGEACPYCQIYYSYDPMNNKVNCTGCPMYMQGNGCNFYESNSSWGRVRSKIGVITDNDTIEPQLFSLIEEYNESNGFKSPRKDSWED